MMRHTRKFMILMVIAAFSLIFALPALGQKDPPAGPRMMDEDVYTPISKGYDLIVEGKYDAAKFEFANAVKKDPFNPFALNNMAVLQEQAGKLNDALANLKDATKNADKYKDKVAQTCFAGGGCMAVKPVRAVADKSAIADIIKDNIAKLEAKIAATKTPPPPASPPPIVPPPKTK